MTDSSRPAAEASSQNSSRPSGTGSARTAGEGAAPFAWRRAVLVLGPLLFAALAGGVTSRGLAWFDAPIATALASLRGPRLTSVMNGVTLLGNGVVLAPLSVVAVAALHRAGRARAALYVAVVAAGSGILTQVLKALFARPRPDALAALATASGYSFPSGHSTAGAAIYGAIAVVGLATLPRLGLAAVVLCGSLVVAVGASRVYLGVHYPSDVLAGWALGLCLALGLRPLLDERRRPSAR